MNPLVGRVPIEIGGRVRELACDMRAVAVLYDAVGEGWSEWLVERFAGTTVETDGGEVVRMAAQVPPADLGLALFAMLASSRGAGAETPESLVAALDDEECVCAQELLMDAVAPCFGLPGDGLEMPPTQQGEKRQWDWRIILQTAFGLMGMRPEDFWSLTLAEWTAMHEGFAVKQHRERYGRAWLASYLLMAAGCKPHDVTPEKLLGLPDLHASATREQAIERMRAADGPDPELVRLAVQASGGRIAADLVEENRG